MNLQDLSGKSNYLKAETYKFIHKGIENYFMGWFNIYYKGKELSVHSGKDAFNYFTIVHTDRTKNKALYSLIHSIKTPNRRQTINEKVKRKLS